MKWRHSKEAQAQKDKEKGEQPDKSACEPGSAEPKEPAESECESEGRSECESDEAQEENSDGQLELSELNKTSVIMSGSGPASGAQAAATGPDTPASSQILIWRPVMNSEGRVVIIFDRKTTGVWKHMWSGSEVEPRLIPGNNWSSSFNF